jgi:integrase/recombinase XerD
VSSVPSTPSFASLLQDFFCQRLKIQRNVSARTVASYRDTFRLLLGYAETRIKKCAVALAMADLDAPFILAFLDHLENERGNSVRTRNVRLAAIRSFLHYAAHQDPISLPIISRVLAIPTKRFDQAVLGFLSRVEVEALIAAPDRSTWSGHRDQVMFTTLYNTGARVSEVIGLRRTDVEFEGARCVHIQGKGRKQRVVPLWSSTVARLKEWIARMARGPEAPLFPNRDGRPLSRSGVEKRLRLAIAEAAKVCPSLVGRRISPHTLRHTTAMHLLQSGVDMTVIALWLGHETPATTHLYVEADLTMKEQALKKVAEPPTSRLRYQAKDRLLAFLDRL